MGVLSTPRQSLVQHRALELVMLLEAKEKGRDRTDALKLALVGHDPQRYLPKMYPEMMPKPTEMTSIDADEGSGPVEYKFTEDVDPREAERLLNDMLRKGKGAMTMSDVEQREQD